MPSRGGFGPPPFFFWRIAVAEGGLKPAPTEGMRVLGKGILRAAALAQGAAMMSSSAACLTLSMSSCLLWMPSFW